MGEAQMKLSYFSSDLSFPSCCSRLYLACPDSTCSSLGWQLTLGTPQSSNTRQTEEEQLTHSKLKGLGLGSQGPFLSCRCHRAETGPERRWSTWSHEWSRCSFQVWNSHTGRTFGGDWLRDHSQAASEIKTKFSILFNVKKGVLVLLSIFY